MTTPILPPEEWKRQKELQKQSTDNFPYKTLYIFTAIFLLFFVTFSIWNRKSKEQMPTKNIDELVDIARESYFSSKRILAIKEIHKKVVNAEIDNNEVFTALRSFMNDKMWEVRHASIMAIASIDNNNKINVFIYALQDENINIQKDAVSLLGDLRGDATNRAIDSLIYTLINSNSEELKEDTKNALVNIGSKSIGPLFYSIGNKKQYSRYYIISALDELNPKWRKSKYARKQVPAFIQELTSNSPLERDIAARALGEIKDKLAMPSLIDALKDNNQGVRGSAAWALGEIKDDKAVDPLLTALHEETTGVQDVAADALIKIGDEKTTVLVVRFWLSHKQGSYLRKYWELTKKVLLNDIRSNNRGTIKKALYSFIGIGNESIIPILIEELNTIGTKVMAEVFLNSGHKELSTAAKVWAEKRGYEIRVGEGAHPVSWGRW